MTTKKSPKKKTAKKLSGAALAKKDAARAMKKPAKKSSKRVSSHAAKNEARKSHKSSPEAIIEKLNRAWKRRYDAQQAALRQPRARPMPGWFGTPGGESEEDWQMDSLIEGPAKILAGALKTDIKRAARRPLSEKAATQMTRDALLELFQSGVLKREGGQLFILKQDGSGFVVLPPKNQMPTAILIHRQILLNEEIDRRHAAGEDTALAYQPHDTFTPHRFGAYPGRRHLGA